MGKVAQQVKQGYGTRYIWIPQADSHEDYRDVERFIATVRKPRLRDRLWRAIQGRGAFRSFKDILAEYRPSASAGLPSRTAASTSGSIGGWRAKVSNRPIRLSHPRNPSRSPEEQPSRDALIEELTLLLIYLCSWEEHPLPDITITIRRAWKGYPFEVLDALEEKGYISQTRRAKSLTLTGEGVLRAQELVARYTL